MISLSATRSIKQAGVGSPYFKKWSRQVTTYRIPLAFLYTVFQYAINEAVVRKKRSFLSKILVRFPGVELSESQLH